MGWGWGWGLGDFSSRGGGWFIPAETSRTGRSPSLIQAPLPPSLKRQHAIAPHSSIMGIPSSYIFMQTSALSSPNMNGAKFWPLQRWRLPMGTTNPTKEGAKGKSRDMPIENWRRGENSRKLPTQLFSTNPQTSQTMILCCKERKEGVGYHLLVCLCLRFLTMSQTSDDHPAWWSCRWPISRLVMIRTRSRFMTQACQWWGWVAQMYSS